MTVNFIIYYKGENHISFSFTKNSTLPTGFLATDHVTVVLQFASLWADCHLLFACQLLQLYSETYVSSAIPYFGKSIELYFHLPSKLAQVITLLTCIWEVHVFILVVTLTILTVFFFVVFPHSLQTDFRMLPQSRWQPLPFQLITAYHHTIWHTEAEPGYLLESRIKLVSFFFQTALFIGTPH